MRAAGRLKYFIEIIQAKQYNEAHREEPRMIEYTPEQIDCIKGFFLDLETIKYPQPFASQIIQANQTDLNMWRMRGILDPETWEKGTRVFYSGLGILEAGFVSQLTLGCTVSASAEIVQGPVRDVVRSVADEGKRGGDFLARNYHLMLSHKSRAGIDVEIRDSAIPDFSDSRLYMPLTKLMFCWASQATKSRAPQRARRRVWQVKA
jgi:hypothetical protein